MSVNPNQARRAIPLTAMVTRPVRCVVPDHARTLAAYISNIINPIIVIVPTIILAGFYGSRDFGAGLLWTAIALLSLCIIPASYVIIGVKRGTLSGLHLSSHRERTGPIAVSLISAVIGVVMLALLGASSLFLAVVYSGVLTSLALAAFTLLWKVSFHSAGITGMVVTSVWLVGALALPLLALIPAVGWARVKLGAHTIGQVLGGAAVAAVVVTLVMAMAR
ncbi:MAG: hypothetical protein DLM69_11560 [Candidatus Chloroheliales bacterium]|nr:MAG: hypothetical protein DLM69_11560 [Chloroflexota bacterium]